MEKKSVCNIMLINVYYFRYRVAHREGGPMVNRARFLFFPLFNKLLVVIVNDTFERKKIP